MRLYTRGLSLPVPKNRREKQKFHNNYMARQKGIIKLEGEIGDIAFFKTKDGGYMAREKTGVSGDRVKNDPAFERTRENGAEFGRAGVAGKVLRAAFRPLILKKGDSRMVSRLTQEMVKVLQADAVSVRGKRNVLDGELELLKGFEFNLSGPLGQTFFAPYNAVIDRVAGTLTITVPPFIPNIMAIAPEGATHFKLNAGGSEVDFEAESYLTSTASSEAIVLGPQEQPAINLVMNVPPASTKPLFLLLGIEFVQVMNGVSYPLKTGVSNSLALVAVDGGA